MERTEMKSRTSWWRRHLLTISLVSLGFILSISSWILLKIDERREAAEDLRTEAKEYSYEFKTAVKMRIMIVDAVRALFLASVKVERDEFAQFVEPLLSQIPGIQALEWIPRVPHAQRMEYEELARREGLADFRITELGTEGAVVPASQRD